MANAPSSFFGQNSWLAAMSAAPVILPSEPLPVVPSTQLAYSTLTASTRPRTSCRRMLEHGEKPLLYLRLPYMPQQRIH